MVHMNHSDFVLLNGQILTSNTLHNDHMTTIIIYGEPMVLVDIGL